ncbi:MAG: cadmium-translocating P-type ATPase [Burkholderiales bacterium]|nr:cadmium-translocating P-type ATPase [Burkholderiales bacterium]
MQAAVLPPLPTREEASTAALDDRGEWSSFSRRLGEGGAERWESYLAIQGMYCPACSLTVEQALAANPGVESVHVNGATATARVVWSPQAGRPSQWFAALKRAGYGALPAGDMLSAVPRMKAQRALLWRWLVAGFCMMQVMMYAVPAYVATAGEMTADVAALLRWASMILTLPVVLFSGGPFFSGAWRDLRNGRIGMDVPVALGILIAFIASTVATFDPHGVLGEEVWFDSVAMFVFFLLSGRLLEQRLRDRTAGALQALMRSLPDTVERETATGEIETVPVRRLAAGDRIRVRAGEVIPVDGMVLEGVSRVDEALLTGESRPAGRTVGQPVVAGSHNLSGTLIVEVQRTGPNTRFSEIVALMERASVDKPRIAQLADRAARPFLVGVLLAAAAAAWWWWPQGPGHALGVAVAVLIVTCPCALSLATPAATLAAAGALARRGVLVRRLEALEAGAAVDTVVFDKTGTLTQDHMAVTAIRTRDGVTEGEALRIAAALARHSLHPASRAIATAGGKVGWTARDVTETPGCGVAGEVAGDSGWQPRRVRLGSATFCHAAAVGEQGAVEVHLADDRGWLAAFRLDESLRANARQSVGALTRMGLGVQLLSGDASEAVDRLAWRTGIEQAWGAQTPEGKLAHVTQLQQAGRRVAMVGDGMNDGPVLAKADVSLAMGQAVPVAQAQADFIILGSQLDRVALALQHARRTHRVVRQNLVWAAAYNFTCIPLAVMGYMPPWLAGLGMAASSLLVVLNAARLSVILPRERG